MKKQRSLKKTFLLSLLVVLITTTLSMLFLIGYSLKTYYMQIGSSSADTLNIYSSELETVMDNLDSLNKSFYLNNIDFQNLGLANYSVNQKIVSEFNVRSIITNIVPKYGAILIFDRTNSVSMYVYGSDFPSGEFLKRADFIKKYKEYLSEEKSSKLFSWQMYKENGYSLLSNTYRFHDLYICSFIDLNLLTEKYNAASGLLKAAFIDQEHILTNQNYINSIGLNHSSLENNNNPFFKQVALKYIIKNRAIKDTNIYICGVLPAQYLWRYSWISIMLAIGVFVILNLLVIYIFQKLRKVIIYPLQQIASATERIEKGQTDSILGETQSSSYEFQRINEALDNLLIQKINLEKENVKKKQETEHAQLQYFQIQTRSHFFVNCLKSLYGMLENKEYERMQRMIFAFSNHIRYIFHDNQMLVPLQSELEEVNDYYNIIMMDRSNPIIMSQSVDEALLKYMVPSLLIQTFLENTVKHNGKTKNMLRFAILIDEIELENGPNMRIRISDNGIGYSNSMLDKLNQQNDSLYEKYHVGISNLKKRIRLIYGDDYQIAFFNEPSGGSCCLICLPLSNQEKYIGG